MRYVFIAGVICGLTASLLPAASRTWKSCSGRFSIEAELIDFKDGKVQLKKTDGKVLSVPLASLGANDQAFVKRQYPGNVEEAKGQPGEKYRTWKDKSGKFTIVAEYLGSADGKVRLSKSDGKELHIQLARLSPSDQRWVKEQLKEEPGTGEETAETPQDDKMFEGLGTQNLEMELVRLTPPKMRSRNSGKRSLQPAEYYFLLTQPQRFYMKLGGESPGQEAFHKTVTKEPTYVAPAPFRAVARLGGQQYAFVLDVIDAKAKGYNKLYFDLNRNGDLTDDGAVTTKDVDASPKTGISQSQFPRVDLKLGKGAQSRDYSFLLSVFCQTGGPLQFATVSLSSAAVREGYLTQGKRKIHLVLLDQNSNGRFDDLISIHLAGNRVYPTLGDLLLINPNPRNLLSLETAFGRDRIFLNRTLCLGKAFYRLEVSPSGENLKMTPAELALGYVTGPGPAYRAMIYSNDYGAMMIGGMKDQKIPLPEGIWKVANYSLDASASPRPGQTAISAAFNDQSVEITVDKGKTVGLPFGTPYKAQVAASKPKDNKVSLSLSILGAAGEQCTSVSVNGARPPAPQFVIKDADGKEVHRGKFEYG
ncbi:MAG: hypothetical protein JXB10_02665 [Pirellulales bacterium]|nr:hypothetical protein [Pirellulales bacterium]